jgi:hypothetical protein
VTSVSRKFKSRYSATTPPVYIWLLPSVPRGCKWLDNNPRDWMGEERYKLDLFKGGKEDVPRRCSTSFVVHT